jgi:hypothetical protein
VSRGWSWDRRFDCVASTFSIRLVPQARDAVTTTFPNEWNSRTLSSAPEEIQDVAERTGGVRSDQLIVATDDADGILAFGLWWPWGGEGTNISLRVGLAGFVRNDLIVDFRDIFGALDD